MILIERYIFRRVAWLSLSALAATTLVVLITQVLRYVNVLTDSNQALQSFATLALLLIPAMVVVVVPFAVLIGVSQVLNSMNADSEMAVMESSGVSHARTAKPVIVFSVLAALGTLAIANAVEPWSNRELRDVVRTARGDLFRLAIQSGSFIRLDAKLYVQITEELPGGDLAGIFIADGRDPATELIYYARRGAVRAVDEVDILFLADGEIHRKNSADKAVSIISFASYALSVSELAPTARSGGYGPKETATADLWSPGPDDKLAMDKPEAVRSELHRRLTEWLYPIVFGLIALCYVGSAQSNRTTRVWSIAAAFAIAMLCRVGGYIAINGAGSSSRAVIVAYAIPLTAIAIFAAIALSGRSAALPRATADLADRIGRVASAFTPGRLLRRPVPAAQVQG